MKTENIYEGKKQIIYRVKKGDCITSLSERFNVPIRQIVALNSLKSEIEAGQRLLLIFSETFVYVADASDTVESIAEKFSVSAEAVVALNGEHCYPTKRFFIQKKTS